MITFTSAIAPEPEPEPKLKPERDAAAAGKQIKMLAQVDRDLIFSYQTFSPKFNSQCIQDLNSSTNPQLNSQSLDSDAVEDLDLIDFGSDVNNNVENSSSKSITSASKIHDKILAASIKITNLAKPSKLLQKQSSKKVQLDQYRNSILFKIKCTSVEKFKVVPSVGIVGAGITRTVNVGINSFPNSKIGSKIPSLKKTKTRNGTETEAAATTTSNNNNSNNNGKDIVDFESLIPSERFQVHILPVPADVQILACKNGQVKFRRLKYSSKNTTNIVCCDHGTVSGSGGLIQLNMKDVNNNDTSNTKNKNRKLTCECQSRSEIQDLKTFWNQVYLEFLKNSKSEEEGKSVLEKHELRCFLGPVHNNLNNGNGVDDVGFQNQTNDQNNNEPQNEMEFKEFQEFDPVAASIPKFCVPLSLPFGLDFDFDMIENLNLESCQEWLSSIPQSLCDQAQNLFLSCKRGFVSRFNCNNNESDLSDSAVTVSGSVTEASESETDETAEGHGYGFLTERKHSTEKDNNNNNDRKPWGPERVLAPVPVSHPGILETEPEPEEKTLSVPLDEASDTLNSKLALDLCDRTEYYCWKYVIFTVGVLIFGLILHAFGFWPAAGSQETIGRENPVVQNNFKNFHFNNKQYNNGKFQTSSGYSGGGDGKTERGTAKSETWTDYFQFNFNYEAVRLWFLAQGNRYFRV